MPTPDYTLAVANPQAIYDPLSGTVSKTSGLGDIRQLTADPTVANLTAMPGIDKIAQMVANINQRAYLSAPGRAEQLANIQRRAAGQLDQDWIDSMQSALAERYGGAGFGVDSQAMNAAMLRAMGLQKYGIQQQAMKDLNEMYANMPQFDPSGLLATPNLYAQYELGKQEAQQRRAALEAQMAMEAARLSQEAGQFQMNLDWARQQEAMRNQLEREKMMAAREASSIAATTAASRGGGGGGGGGGGWGGNTLLDWTLKQSGPLQPWQIRNIMTASTLSTSPYSSMAANPSYAANMALQQASMQNVLNQSSAFNNMANAYMAQKMGLTTPATGYYGYGATPGYGYVPTTGYVPAQTVVPPPTAPLLPRV